MNQTLSREHRKILETTVARALGEPQASAAMLIGPNSE